MAQHVNAIHPRPDLAVFVGDVVHNALDASNNYTWFLHNRNALTVASELFQQFTLPVYFMWGMWGIDGFAFYGFDGFMH